MNYNELWWTIMKYNELNKSVIERLIRVTWSVTMKNEA
jgi:hypothetical protein